mmetsp:Transcript_82740/g.192256  ORF Transcript_82740/g.192256 Transcript_82740/m.192256 type:complete len:379 (-) Transcript_82740:365-1501(-)
MPAPHELARPPGLQRPQMLEAGKVPCRELVGLSEVLRGERATAGTARTLVGLEPQRKLPWVIMQVLAAPVHHIRKGQTSGRVAEADAAPGTSRAEGALVHAEGTKLPRDSTLGRRLHHAVRDRHLDAQHLVAPTTQPRRLGGDHQLGQGLLGKPQRVHLPTRVDRALCCAIHCSQGPCCRLAICSWELSLLNLPGVEGRHRSHGREPRVVECSGRVGPRLEEEPAHKASGQGRGEERLQRNHAVKHRTPLIRDLLWQAHVELILDVQRSEDLVAEEPTSSPPAVVLVCQLDEGGLVVAQGDGHVPLVVPRRGPLRLHCSEEAPALVLVHEVFQLYGRRRPSQPAFVVHQLPHCRRPLAMLRKIGPVRSHLLIRVEAPA